MLEAVRHPTPYGARHGHSHRRTGASAIRASTAARSCAAPSSPARSAPPSSGTTSSSTAPSPAWSSPSSIFPQSDPLVGTLQAFAIYAVGFVARPIGAAIFGHYGDRIGRKSALIATLMLMGIATFLVAFVPTYDSIGIWGAVILTRAALRPGHRRRRRMGRLGAAVDGMGAHQRSIAASSRPGRSSACRRACSSPTWRCSSSARCPATQFLDLGLAHPVPAQHRAGRRSASTSGCGILETPVFARLVGGEAHRARAGARGDQAPAARRSSCRRSRAWREQAPFYIFTAFVFTYGTGTLQVSRDFLLAAVLCRVGRLVLHDPALRPPVRPHRPQAHVHDRRRRHRHLRLRLLRLLDTRRAGAGSSSRSCCR